MIPSRRFSPAFIFRILLLVVLSTVFFVYGPSLNNDFVNWDDDVHVLENRFLRTLDSHSLKEIFSTTVNHTYIPLTILSFALEYKWFGGYPFIYHLDNVLLHVMVTALVMILAQRLGLSVAASALAALIFGVHPMHVESVAWVTERKDVLYSVFYLWSILVYLKFVDSQRRRYLYLSVGLAFLSILAKSMALSLPIVLLLIDWFYKGRIRWRDIVHKGYFAVVMAPIAWISYVANAGLLKSHAINDLLVWIWCHNFYLIKFIFPSESALLNALPYPVSIQNAAYLSNLVIFFAVGAWLWIRRHDRWVIFAYVFYLGSIFFLLRFHVILDAVADRFMYLPSLGWCFLVAIGVERALKSSQKKIFVFCAILCALTLVLCSLIWMTRERTLVWKDSIALWQNQLKNNSSTARWLAYNKLGDAYLDSNRVQNALQRLAQDRRLADKQSIDLGYAEHQRPEDTDAIRSVIDLYRKAIDDKPDYAEPYFNLGRVYQSLGDVKTAIYFYEQAFRRDHKHFMALLRLADMYRHQGRAHEAVEMYKRAIMANPHNPEILATVKLAYRRAVESGDHAEVYRSAQEELQSLIK